MKVLHSQPSATTCRLAFLYSIACILLCFCAPAPVHAQTVTALWQFCSSGSGCPDKDQPYGPLIQGSDGNFYGTDTGGANNTVLGGAVFQITPGGALSTLYDFGSVVSSGACNGFSGNDGSAPVAGLVQGTDGNFYGVTSTGGCGAGTVFQITKAGTLTTLHRFVGSDGADPLLAGGALLQGADGSFYGTTNLGGTGAGSGTIFKITSGGAFTTIYSFCPAGNFARNGSGCADGAFPYAGLIQGTDGNLYGTTYEGGNLASQNGVSAGTIFRVTPSGVLSTLYSFCQGGGSCTDGAFPGGALVQDTDGNFYGTTQSGGNAVQGGTVFKITPGGSLTTLYAFCQIPVPGENECTDGEAPNGGLIQGTDGNFYGTTLDGGASGYGTIFRITPGGTLTTLYSFCPGGSCANGGKPAVGLVQGTDGSFYGTATVGGSSPVRGTVFKLQLPQVEPTVDWSSPAPIFVGAALGPEQLNATASYHGTPVAGKFAYSPTAGTVLGIGTDQTLSVQFTPTDTTDYAPATATVQITVSPAGPTVVPSTVISTTGSGLTYSRVSKTYTGTVTITNLTNSAIAGPISVSFTGLPTGVTLTNATGTYQGVPYITVSSTSSLGPGQSATVAVQFGDPSNVRITFTPVIYSGSLN